MGAAVIVRRHRRRDFLEKKKKENLEQGDGRTIVYRTHGRTMIKRITKKIALIL